MIKENKSVLREMVVIVKFRSMDQDLVGHIGLLLVALDKLALVPFYRTEFCQFSVRNFA